MASQMTGSELRHLARLGAQARLEQIEREAAELRRNFPELNGRRSASASAGPASPRRRGRKRMSAAERKAVSERMKKFWADRRRAKAAGRTATK